MWSIAVVVFLSFLQLCVGGEYCYDGIYSQYCSWECCDYDRSQCCDYARAAVALGVGVIVAIVIGVAIFIGAIIALICCCCRRQGYAGSVRTAQPATGVVIASQTTTQVPAGAYGQPYGVQYGGQPMSPQYPGYGQTNMGYAGDMGTAPPAYSTAAATPSVNPPKY